MLGLFERIASKLKSKRLEKVEDYRELVAAIGSGQETDPDEVEKILDASGKTLDDLKGAVGAYQKRVHLRGQLDSLPSLEAEQAELQEKIRKADSVFAKAEEHHSKTVSPLSARLEDARRESLVADQAKGELLRTCPYPELLERKAELSSREAELGQQVSESNRVVSVLTNEVGEIRFRIQQGGLAPQELGDLEASIGEKERKASKHKAEVAEVEKERAQVQADLRDLEASMLRP